MKTLAELQYLDLEVGSGEVFFSYVSGLKSRKLDMDVYLPSKNMNLQRDHVWTIQQKSELIMSILMERFIPNIAAISLLDNDDSDGDDILQIIDGKQRISAMMDFYDNKFTIQLEGQSYRYCDLPEEYQRAIHHYPIKCQIAYDNHGKPISDQAKIDWFKMINFAGTPQDSKHIEKLEKS